MAASNRAARLTKLVADLKKRYKPAPPATRPLFETLLYATLVENSAIDAADQALADLQKGYFDWNEVRVSSRAELAERLKPLADPTNAADRLKRTLQSVFESVYAFDLEAMKKQNLGQAVKQIAAYDGVTSFAVAFATQHGLAGHSIAVNKGVLLALEVMEIVTPAESKKGVVPGLERAIPKNKGVEAQAALHQMGVEILKSPYGTATRKLLTELDPTCKDRLPKKPVPPKPAEKPAAKKKAAASKTATTKTSAEKPAADKKKPTAAKASAEKAPTKKASAAKPAKKKAPAKDAATKKKAPASKKGTTKKPAGKVAAKTPAKKTTKKAATAGKKSTAKTPVKKKKVAKKKAKRKPK